MHKVSKFNTSSCWVNWKINSLLKNFIKSSMRRKIQDQKYKKIVVKSKQRLKIKSKSLRRLWILKNRKISKTIVILVKTTVMRKINSKILMNQINKCMPWRFNQIFCSLHKNKFYLQVHSILIKLRINFNNNQFNSLLPKPKPVIRLVQTSTLVSVVYLAHNSNKCSKSINLRGRPHSL